MQVAGIWSPFKCREGGDHFTGPLSPPQAGSWQGFVVLRMEPRASPRVRGGGEAVETNQAKMSLRMVVALRWAEDKEERTHGGDHLTKTWARTQEMWRNGSGSTGTWLGPQAMPTTQTEGAAGAGVVNKETGG